MSPKGALVVIGSGPGIGRSTAAYFAKQGFERVVLLSRDASRLAEDAKVVSSASSAVKVDTQTIDMAADEATVKEMLAKVDAVLTAAGVPLEAVLYNAARVGPSRIMEWEARGLEEDLKVCTTWQACNLDQTRWLLFELDPSYQISSYAKYSRADTFQITTVNLYVTLQWAVPQLLNASKVEDLNPAFLVTSGGLYYEPFPFLFSLAAAKASQYNLMYSFHEKFEPAIHFASIPVTGLVSDDAKVTTASAVAEQFWQLYSQPKGTKGKRSVEMTDPDYYAGVEGFRKMVEGQ